MRGSLKKFLLTQGICLALAVPVLAMDTKSQEQVIQEKIINEMVTYIAKVDPKKLGVQKEKDNILSKFPSTTCTSLCKELPWKAIAKILETEIKKIEAEEEEEVFYIADQVETKLKKLNQETLYRAFKDKINTVLNNCMLANLEKKKKAIEIPQNTSSEDTSHKSFTTYDKEYAAEEFLKKNSMLLDEILNPHSTVKGLLSTSSIPVKDIQAHVQTLIIKKIDEKYKTEEERKPVTIKFLKYWEYIAKPLLPDGSIPYNHKDGKIKTKIILKAITPVLLSAQMVDMKFNPSSSYETECAEFYKSFTTEDGDTVKGQLTGLLTAAYSGKIAEHLLHSDFYGGFYITLTTPGREPISIVSLVYNDDFKTRGISQHHVEMICADVMASLRDFLEDKINFKDITVNYKLIGKGGKFTSGGENGKPACPACKSYYDAFNKDAVLKGKFHISAEELVKRLTQ